MIALVYTIIGVFLKILQVGARVALNRATVIVAFVATIATTFSAIYSSLTDVDGVLSTAVDKVSSAQLSIGEWVASNDYAQMIGYALSIDCLCEGIVTTFIFVFCTLSGFLLTALFYTFVSVVPLLSDLAVSALKRQFASALMSSG